LAVHLQAIVREVECLALCPRHIIKIQRFPLNNSDGGPQSHSIEFREEENVSVLPGIGHIYIENTINIRHSAINLVQEIVLTRNIAQVEGDGVHNTQGIYI